MLHDFTLQNLIELDGGRIPEAWIQAVRRCANDCDDRPGVTDPRKVTLTLDLSPVCDEEGRLETIRGQFQIKDTSPVRKTKKYDLAFRRKSGQAQLVFNDLSDDNALQMTIDESEGRDA